MQETNEFYNNLEIFANELKKRSTNTISDEKFKSTIKDLFIQWKSKIKLKLENCKVFDKSKIDEIDSSITELYNNSRKRVAKTNEVILLATKANDLLFRHILIPSKSMKNLHVYSLQREDLIKRLNLAATHFEIASDYFEEAKSCFKFGFFRAATIMAISALESCLRTDYHKISGVEYNGKLFSLINRYFSGDVKRLPKQYEDFSKTYIKIRNSFTHPEEFDYSETIVFNVLSTVLELIKAIESLY